MPKILEGRKLVQTLISKSNEIIMFSNFSKTIPKTILDFLNAFFFEVLNLKRINPTFGNSNRKNKFIPITGDGNPWTNHSRTFDFQSLRRAGPGQIFAGLSRWKNAIGTENR